MTIWLWRVLIALTVLAALAVAAGRAGLLQGSPPTNLGVRDGRLAAPSKTPNSVSSQADLWPGHPQQSYARITPLAAPLARVRRAVESMPGAKIADSRPDYLYVQFTTPLMRYVDDAEFWADPATGVVQVRSASRIGHGDMGANRARIEALRAALAAPS